MLNAAIFFVSYFLKKSLWYRLCILCGYYSQYIFLLLLQGNVILCGLRNGAIVTADFRERRESLSDRLITHRIPYNSDTKVGSSKKEWFKVFFCYGN